ncbi:MAG: hypothetical protein AMS27_15755 [Bacteroides sp. SM23_62_1]|nr:MAG: hypothetical protein AMS27_15755 [Bacteroides sp. SM23_62_1]
MPEFIQGGAIKVRYFSNLVIDRCTIQYSQGLWDGGISLDMFSDPVITNNIIYKNMAMDCGAGINCKGSSNPMILNNIIINNKSIGGNGGGINLENSNPVIQNNIMCNNYGGHSGGGIQFLQSNAKFSNNTVCNNFSPLGPGIGIWACSPVIYNSIIYGNRDGSADNIQQCRTFPDNDYYYNNIEGGIRGISHPWGEHQGIHIGIIDTPPFFKNPTSGAGLEYDALHADWSLTDLSPNINRGTIDTTGLNLPPTDIAGNRRIHYNRVDIGAYENQSYPIAIIKQPANKILCVGDSTSFTIQVNGTATYQWYKNNDSIAGAVDSILTINPAGLVDEANYYCMVTNGYGPVQSNNVFLVVKTHPKILIEPESQWVDMNKPLKLRMTVDGTAPISYQWLKDSVQLQSENLPELNLETPTFDDEGVYHCVVSNACSEVMTDPIVIYMAPQICMVTVDPMTGNNLVVWEKNSIAPITDYDIYRESNYAGIYDLLTTVPYDNLSIYNDTTADPTSRAYLYKITAVDTSGYETDMDLCKTHKTIHLLVTTNPETKATQLDWDRYVGFEYGTYEILRSDTTTNFLSIDATSSSTSTWSDPDPGTGIKYYRIAALRPEPCYPVGSASKKAESGPYSHSMSNMEDNRLQTGIFESLLINENLLIHPNLFNETAILTFNNPEGLFYTLHIMDLSGKTVRVVNDITTSEFVLERENLKEGFYFIELRGPEIYRGKIIVE